MSRIEEVLKRANREQLLGRDGDVPAAESRSQEETAPDWDFASTSDVEAAATTVVVPPAAAVEPEPEEVAEPETRWAPVARTERPDARIVVAAAPEPVDAGANVLITRTPRFDAIEQYRKLAASLHEAQVERGLRSVLCTSAVMGEGKTVTACNLALTLSESYGRRVLLMDADLRRPQVHAMFKVANDTGLTDLLGKAEDSKLTIRQVTPRLSVATAGPSSSDPMTGLTSGRLRQVIAEASHRFDWVIVDTPPVLLLPDARVLVSMVDAVLLVVRAGSTPYRLVLRAVDVIKRDRIFGTVLNSVEKTVLDAEYGGYESYYSAVRSA